MRRGASLAAIALAMLAVAGRPAADIRVDRKRVAALAARLERASAAEAVHVASQIRELGPQAHDATPALIKRSKAAPWNDRVKFIEVIGAVGDERCVSFLSDALSSPDWRVALAAADALGALGDLARPALPALASTASGHWYPHVRNAASKSQATVSAASPGATYRAKGFLKLLLPGCHVPQGGDWLAKADLAAVTDPAVARVVEEAGELFAIVQQPWALVLLQNSGTVSILERGAKNDWKVRPAMQLPDAPRAYRAMPDGTLGIATKRGVVFLKANAEVETYNCAENDLEKVPVFYEVR